MNSKTRTYVRNTTSSKSKSLSPLKSNSLTPSKSKSLTPLKSNSLTPLKSNSLTPSKSKSLSPLKSKSITQSDSSNSILETPVSDILTQFFSPKSESLTPSESESLTPLKSKSLTPLKSKSLTPSKSKSFSPVSERLTQTINLVEKEEQEEQDYSSMFTFPNIQNSIMTYGIVLVALVILGVNAILYLGISDSMYDFFKPVIERVIKPILSFFGYTLADLTRTTTELTATGAIAAVDVVADTTKSVVSTGKDAIVSSVDTVEDAVEQEDNEYEDLKRDLKNRNNNYNSPVPDEQTSAIQKNKSIEKAGYCLVGKDRGIRSCMKVESSDVCMSGEIFPSRHLCINPNLRV